MRRCYMVDPDHALSMITVGGMASCLQLDQFNPDTDPMPMEVWKKIINGYLCVVIGYIGQDSVVIMSGDASDSIMQLIPREDFKTQYQPLSDIPDTGNLSQIFEALGAKK